MDMQDEPYLETIVVAKIAKISGLIPQPLILRIRDNPLWVVPTHGKITIQDVNTLLILAMAMEVMDSCSRPLVAAHLATHLPTR